MTVLPALAAFGLAAALPIASIIPAVSYYYLPLISMISCVALAWLGRGDSGQQWPAIALSGLVGLLCAIAIGSITGHLLMTRWLVWGLFPINDAADFLTSAQRLLLDGTFYTPRGRVLSNLIYAGWLSLTGFDMRVILWSMSALVALAIAGAAASMHRALGWSAAAIGAYVLFDFAHEHIGGVTTELPGLIFGLGGFALVLGSAVSRAPVVFLAGFTLISVAMLTRVGAVFLLPALLLWSIFALRPVAGWRLLAPVLGAAIMALAFTANSSLTTTFAPSSGGGFVNAIDSWYASVVEGEVVLGDRDPASVVPVTPWVQIYHDYPDIKALPTAAQPARKLEIFKAKLSEAPFAAVVGGAWELGRFVFQFEMFRFINVSAVRFVIFAFAMIGLIAAIRGSLRGRDRLAGLLALSGLAILASQPFLLGGESRTPAPSIGFLAALAGWGTCVVSRWLRPSRNHGAISVSAWATIPLGVAPACVLLGLAAAGGVGAGSWRDQTAPLTACKTGEIAAVIRFDLASGVRIADPGWHMISLGEHKSWLIELRKARNRLRKPLYEPHEAFLEPLIAAARTLPNGGHVIQATDVSHGRTLPLLAVSQDALPARAGMTALCLTATETFVAARAPAPVGQD